jgi:hypothetical protein
MGMREARTTLRIVTIKVVLFFNDLIFRSRYLPASSSGYDRFGIVPDGRDVGEHGRIGSGDLLRGRILSFSWGMRYFSGDSLDNFLSSCERHGGQNPFPHDQIHFGRVHRASPLGHGVLDDNRRILLPYPHGIHDSMICVQRSQDGTPDTLWL